MSDSENAVGADILIVEDEAPISRLMSLHLRAAGFTTHCCEDGEQAMALIGSGQWRLVVLDRMLPGASGMKVLRSLRQNPATARLPVLMVTALSMASERVHGLNEGADDYLAKPFEPDELVARAKALLRRSAVVEQGEQGAALASGIQLDPEAPLIMEGEKQVELRPLEYKLLQILMAKPGKTRSREYLLDHVWGYDAEVEERTVDVTVKRLRKALKKLGRQDCIQTVRSMGYRYVIAAE